MRRVAEGDPVAFRTLVERHSGRLARLAERIAGSRAEAEEIVQDTFLRLWLGAADWQPRAQPGTWLWRVATNLAIDRRRRLRPVALDDVPEPPDPAPDGEAVTVAVEIAGAVRAAMAELPPRQRAALTLCHYEGQTMAEAARALDTSEGAVESLLIRARAGLRARLAGLAAEVMQTGTAATDAAGRDKS